MLTRSQAVTNPKPKSGRVVVCLTNEGYNVSLESRKLYVALPDADAERHGQLRILDESGEDYLYPAHLFAAVELPDSVRKAVMKAG